MEMLSLFFTKGARIYADSASGSVHVPTRTVHYIALCTRKSVLHFHLRMCVYSSMVHVHFFALVHVL